MGITGFHLQENVVKKKVMKGPVFLRNPDPDILNPGKFGDNNGRMDEYDIIMRIGVKPKKRYVRKFEKNKE